MNNFEFGIYSLGERTDKRVSAQERIEQMIQIGRMADEAGLDIFGVGEHHRPDFVTASYALILAGIARETKRIKLTSTLTVIGAVDPVRVYEDFATLDLLSGGRAEILVGRGAFVEAFSLFGADLAHYDELFAEKLDLLIELRRGEAISWRGQFRPALNEVEIAPRPLQATLPIWVGIGKSVAGAERAGHLGLNLAISLVGSSDAEVKVVTDAYWRAARMAGHRIEQLQVSLNGHLYVGRATEFLPYYDRYVTYFGREMQSFESLLVGSSEQLVERTLQQHEQFGHTRLMGQVDIAGMPLAQVERVIDKLANEVAPKVRHYTNVALKG